MIWIVRMSLPMQVLGNKYSWKSDICYTAFLYLNSKSARDFSVLMLQFHWPRDCKVDHCYQRETEVWIK